VQGNSLKNKIKFGLLGFGTHVEKHILRAFTLCKNAQLCAIGTRDSIKAQRLSKSYPEFHIYNSYEELLTNSELDAIYIALPNDMHCHWTISALQANKHVLCEKPLALNANQVLQMQSAATQANRKVLEGFMYRFHPRHHKVREIIRGGIIGDLRYFEAHYQYFNDNYDNIRLKKENGGGGLFDVGCYTIDAARFFLNQKPISISGRWILDERSGVDVCANFQLQFENNITAHLNCGSKLPRANNYSIYGTKGIIHVFDAFNIPANKPSFIELQGMDLSSKDRIRIEASNHFQIMFDEFSDWIQGKPVRTECFGNGLENAHILDAARTAAESNRSIPLSLS